MLLTLLILLRGTRVDDFLTWMSANYTIIVKLAGWAKMVNKILVVEDEINIADAIAYAFFFHSTLVIWLCDNHFRFCQTYV